MQIPIIFLESQADLRHMTQQAVCTATSLPLARRINLLLTLVTPVAGGPWALLVITLVDLGVGVTKLDGNIPDQLVLESDSLHARYGLDHRRLSVSDMANGADVDGGLPSNDFGGQGAESADIEVFRVRLGRELWSLNWRRRGTLLHRGLQGLRHIGDLIIGEILLVMGLVARLGARVSNVIAKLVAVGSHDCG